MNVIAADAVYVLVNYRHNTPTQDSVLFKIGQAEK